MPKGNTEKQADPKNKKSNCLGTITTIYFIKNEDVFWNVSFTENN